MRVALFYRLAQEGAHHLAHAAGESSVEDIVVQAVQWLRLIVEIIGALIVALGVVVAVYQFVRAFPSTEIESYNRIRLTLARYLALALEFQLGADILSTAIAPSWEQIGKLGAIAVIRTGLNYFLMREMNAERAEDRREAERGESAEAGRVGDEPARRKD